MRTPGFTVIAVTSIALGIGATTAIFTLVDQVLLRRLPVQAPHELVQVRMEGSLYGSNWGDGSELSFPWYRELRDEGTPFAGVLGRFATSMHLGAGGRTERLDGEMVTGSYFPVLGVLPAVGRAAHRGRRPRAGRPSCGRGELRLLAGPLRRQSRESSGATSSSTGIRSPSSASPRTDLTASRSGARVDIFVPTMMKKLITPGWDALDERTLPVGPGRRPG